MGYRADCYKGYFSAMPNQIKIDQAPFSSLFAYFRRTLSSEDLPRSSTTGGQRQRLCWIHELSTQVSLQQLKIKQLEIALALHEVKMRQLRAKLQSRTILGTKSPQKHIWKWSSEITAGRVLQKMLETLFKSVFWKKQAEGMSDFQCTILIWNWAGPLCWPRSIANAP